MWLSEDELQKNVAYKLNTIVANGCDTMSHIACELGVSRHTISRIRDRAHHPSAPADVSLKTLAMVANYLGYSVNTLAPRVVIQNMGATKTTSVSHMKRMLLDRVRSYKNYHHLTYTELARRVNLDCHTVKEMLHGRVPKRDHRWTSWVKLSSVTKLTILSSVLYSVTISKG